LRLPRAARKEPLDREQTVKVLAKLWYHALYIWYHALYRGD
jgi:hypothetical protein